MCIPVNQPVDVKGICMCLPLEALAEDKLEDIASLDALLSFCNSSQELLLGHVRVCGRIWALAEGQGDLHKRCAVGALQTFLFTQLQSSSCTSSTTSSYSIKFGGHCGITVNGCLNGGHTIAAQSRACEDSS